MRLLDAGPEADSIGDVAGVEAPLPFLTQSSCSRPARGVMSLHPPTLEGAPVRPSASLALLGVLLAASPTLARTWYITPDGTGDAPTIQAGVGLSAVGDTVEVACGTYYEHDIDMKSGVTLRSETGQAACATIDAQQLGRVILCDGVDETSVIEGFTITGGLTGDVGGGVYCLSSSPVIRSCSFVANSSPHGGGLLCHSSSPTLESCAFIENICPPGTRGGGMSCRSFSSPTLSDCLFSANSADRGGGMYCFNNSSPTLTDCTFSANTAAQFSGALHCENSSSPALVNCRFEANSAGEHGGAITCFGSSPHLMSCLFLGNHATEAAGAVGCADGSSATIADCTFSENSAGTYGGGCAFSVSSPALIRSSFEQNTAGVHGGALSCWTNSSPAVDSCIFSDNQAGLGGGAAHCEDHSAPEFTNCVFVANTAAFGAAINCYENAAPDLTSCTVVRNTAVNFDGGAIMGFESSTPTLLNSIISFSERGGAVQCQSGSAATLVCTDVYGNSGGNWVGCIGGQANLNGNFSADPLFCDPEAGDFTIPSDSPCAPPGVTGCGLIGALPVGCGLVSVEAESWGRIKAMYRDEDARR